MENSIDWSTWIVAISTVVTAGATIVLAVITSRYIQLTDSLLKATYKPQIFISPHSETFTGSITKPKNSFERMVNVIYFI